MGPMRRARLLTAAALTGAVLAFSAVAALAANRFADTPRDDLPGLALTLAATGSSGLLAWPVCLIAIALGMLVAAVFHSKRTNP